MTLLLNPISFRVSNLNPKWFVFDGVEAVDLMKMTEDDTLTETVVQTLNNVALIGPAFDEQPLNYWTDCQELCINTLKCKVSTFNTGTKKCFLKESYNTVDPTSGTVSTIVYRCNNEKIVI